MFQFKLPDIGEGTAEAEIINWRVKVGDRVREDDPLVEVQSDKATVDLPSPVAGVVTKLVGVEGDLARVGSVIVEIQTEANAPAAPAAPVAAGSPSFPPVAASAPVSEQDLAQVRHLAVPRVRHFARTHGIDLHLVTGTGRAGKITMADVEAALSAPAPVAPAPVAPAPVAGSALPATPLASGLAPAAPAGTAASPASVGTAAPAAPVGTAAPAGTAAGAVASVRREPMSPVRRATARAMVNAVTTVPHVTVFDRADVTRLVEHRARLRPLASERGIKLTYTPYIVKACVAMLRRHQALNAYVDMQANEIVYRGTRDITVAINTDAGLLVPVVRDADRLSLFEIATEVDRLAAAAQAGQLTHEQMRGGSLTVTNVGGAATAGVWSTPILNVPEAVIVGIGRIEGEFLPDAERQPVLREVMKISFAFDHRLVDGVAAQRALNDLKAFLSDPDLLFAEA